MRGIVTLAAVALALPTAAYADAAVEAPIRAMAEAFNHGDIAAAKATHIAAPVIIDADVAPYVWQGPQAFDTWVGDLGRKENATGKTGGTVALGAAIVEMVEGANAYVVVPSTYTFQQAGRTMRETGTMTFVLTKTAAAWKIKGWTWTSPEAVPVG